MLGGKAETDGVVVSPEELAHLRLMKNTVDHARDYVMIVEWTGSDPPYLIRYVNEAFTRLTGYERAEMAGGNPMMMVGPDTDSGLLQEKLSEVLAGRFALFDLLHYRKDGQTVWLELSIFPLQGPDGNIKYSISVGRDISERRKAETAVIRAQVAEENNEALRTEIADRKCAEEQLAYAAFHDSLTSLPNRALFIDRTESALARNLHREGRAAAVLFIDCDGFKLVNDSLGHSIGDRLLIATARRLETVLRPGDTLARIGGDEFTMLLEDIPDDRAATTVAERLLKAFSKPFRFGGQDVFATVSIGIALSSPSCGAAEELLRDADIAMYRAKVLGKNRCHTFSSEMRAQATRLLRIQTAMRGALASDRLAVAYQPVVSLADGHIEGFEALARWHDAGLGEVLAAEFIPIAEETGLIVSLGAVVLRNACAQVRRWQLEFPEHCELSVNVNVSVKQLLEDRFVDEVVDVLHATGLQANCLQLEITEGVLMKERERIAKTLVKLRAHGVKLDVDDFGTGYSSLGYLASFPLDVLKIDRSFVSAQGNIGLANPEIVRTVISLAGRLGLSVIAEGVETEQQKRELQKLGCGSAQGYYFAEPLDVRSASKYLCSMAASPVALSA